MNALEKRFFSSKFAQWWLLVPFCFLFLTLQLAWQHSSAFTTFLPLISCLGIFFSIVYRTKGLIIAYSLLTLLVLYFYQSLLPEENLWQMGLIFSLAVDFFIALLLIEWTDEERMHIEKKNEEQEKKLVDINEHFLQEEKKYQDYIDSLKESMQNLMQEAEQRRIDRVREQALLREEIKIITSQKNLLHEEIDKMKLALEESRAQIDAMAASPSKTEVIIMPDKSIEREYKQIRKQFEEKSHILNQTRQELFATQTELLGLQRQEYKDEEGLWHWLTPLLLEAAEEQKQLEEEISLLEQIK